MWPGQQPPGGEQNPQQQNPYQQPGYQQQPNPYQQQGPYPQQPGQQPGWQAPPTAQMGAQPPGGGGSGKQTKIIAIAAALAVVVAAGVTGVLVMGGEDEKDDEAKGGGGSPSTSASSPTKPSTPPPGGDSAPPEENPRGGEEIKPTITGWQVVVNPKYGTAFDVPADWELQSPDTIIGFEEDNAEDVAKPLITMSAPAYFKSKWCSSDDNKDGQAEDNALAAVGTKGANGAKNAEEVAVNQVPWWVYGGYTQPDKKSLTNDKKAKPYTTKAGIEGMVARASSANTPQKGKCASDGKAITFGFKNANGDFVAWNLYGAKGVKGEVSEALIVKILSTVRYSDEAPAT